MPSFFDLSIAASALRAHQQALSTTGHNIANANTEGYRRQEVVFRAGNPLTGQFVSSGPGCSLLGSGVVVEAVRRMQTDYIDGQVRSENQSFGFWNSRNQSLQQVEALYSEPGDYGLSAVMDRFWNSWQDLASTPESLPARIAVVESSSALADRVRSLHVNLRSLQTDIDGVIAAKAGEMNRIASQIAGLNEQITRSLSGGYEPNDLMDRRDLLVEQLSLITRVEVHGASGSDMIISIGGKAFVQGTNVNNITVTQGAGGRSTLIWSDDLSPVSTNGGELKGLIDMRDTVIEGHIDSLNTIAGDIISRVNALHSAGTDRNGDPAGGFFAGVDASDISVEPAVIASPALVSASGNGRPGDNSTADGIAGIKDEILIDGLTIAGAYEATVSRLGSQVREAVTQSSVHRLAVKQLINQRESISGVSLDEEMVNLTRFQQAYNAAARVFTVIDEMIDTIINRTGIGGR